jgi:formylglycine-generating enzyme required for sulfatase activity
MPKVFISHRWAEGEHKFACELKEALENYEDIKVLLDEYEMLPGDTIQDWMDDAIQKGCDVFLFVLSPHALESKNCMYELDLARETGVPIIPVFIRDCEIPEKLKGILYADFRKGLHLPFHSVERLVKGIRRQAERRKDRVGEVVYTEQVNPKDGAAMVWIPAGEFLMGTTDAQIADLLKRFPDWERSWFEDEKPQRRIYLDGYWMYKHEVTVEQYRRFCAEMGRSMPTEPRWGWREDHPIVNVTWYDAMAYCKWAGVRLPTGAEWEKAARGTDGRLWPWGNEWDGSRCKGVESGIRATTSVGAYPSGVSPYGVMDVAGNVWEWCLDEYDAKFYAKGPERNPICGGSISSVTSNITNVKAARVLRGGSWANTPFNLRVANRSYSQPSYTYFNVGFRCAGPVTP